MAGSIRLLRNTQIRVMPAAQLTMARRLLRWARITAYNQTMDSSAGQTKGGARNENTKPGAWMDTARAAPSGTRVTAAVQYSQKATMSAPKNTVLNQSMKLASPRGRRSSTLAAASASGSSSTIADG